jgi:hypothetical protein
MLVNAEMLFEEGRELRSASQGRWAKNKEASESQKPPE